VKKTYMWTFTLMVLFAPAVIFASSCGSEEETFFIKYTLEGNEYVLNYGLADVRTGEPFAILDPIAANGDVISLFGSTIESDSSEVREDLENSIDVKGRLLPHTPEVYEDEYDAARNSDQSFGRLSIYIREDKAEYLYGSTSGTITVTSFGPVGEAVEGTFDIIFETDMEPAGIGDSPLSVTGEFRLKRISQEDIPLN
jgi:hypothetical protein